MKRVRLPTCDCGCQLAAETRRAPGDHRYPYWREARFREKTPSARAPATRPRARGLHRQALLPLIVGFTIAAALVPVLAPTLFKQLPEWSQPFLHSSVVIACLVSVLLNAALNGVSVPQTTAAKSASHIL